MFTEYREITIVIEKDEIKDANGRNFYNVEAPNFDLSCNGFYYSEESALNAIKKEIDANLNF